MRNILKTAVVGAIAAAFVASVAVADGQGPGQRGGPGRGGPGGPGGPGGRGPIPGLMQDLTPEQREQVKTILDEQRGDRQGPPPDAKLRRDLDAELLADTVNDQKVEEIRAQLLAAQGDALTAHIAVQKRIAQVLTPEQRAKARERLAQAPGEGRGRRGGPGRGPGGPNGLPGDRH